MFAGYLFAKMKKKLIFNISLEYVKRYTSFILDTSISKQFEPFKREFYHVCRRNALFLFRSEEIELLIRRSRSLDVDQLRAVALYDSSNSSEVNSEKVIQCGSNFAKKITCIRYRIESYFCYRSTNLLFKIFILGNDCNRYSIAHTSNFNQLCIYRYETREKLCNFLITAIFDSEGFGLK
ncbi:hypothetical protein PNEG_00556 [Pneumocystis murina B123]|uniref:HECT-type E3 ubiquitin transferase n=1 Tax=Pneumocystis murina (strain B123) TaxID=1069680 RepID=M7NS16_PNEMU|nr:hypothetical protein PNEG_00556 [Pneumocystis murina B123]EMR11548.1 hypothetical protein PNEG_00556 [Pneumocystis murina B123]